MSSTVPQPRISIVVPAREAEATIGNCLSSLLRLHYPASEREIIVVYTASSDRTEDVLGRYPVRCVESKLPGLSRARNVGIEASRGEIVAFTDADCYVATNWLEGLIAGLAEDVSAAAGEVVAFPPSTPAERYAAMRKPLWQQWTHRGRSRPWFLLGNAALRREVFEQVGLFDPRFVGGSEDIDFCWRFFERGLSVRYVPEAVVFHRHRLREADLFRQHVGYGRGQATLRRKYPHILRWGWRQEWAAIVDLGRTAGAAAKARARAGDRRKPSDDASYPYFDFIRKLGQRIGFVRGTLFPT